MHYIEHLMVLFIAKDRSLTYSVKIESVSLFKCLRRSRLLKITKSTALDFTDELAINVSFLNDLNLE